MFILIILILIQNDLLTLVPCKCRIVQNYISYKIILNTHPWLFIMLCNIFTRIYITFFIFLHVLPTKYPLLTYGNVYFFYNYKL